MLALLQLMGRHWLRNWLAGLSMLLLVPCAWAASNQIEVHAPYTAVVNGVYGLNAELVFVTPQEVERTVRDGATLNLELQVRLTRARTWWRDEVLAQLQQRYTLIYHAVSERYLVRNVNSGAQTSYATFEQAINFLQHVENLPVLDQALVAADPRNQLSVRAYVTVRSIPRVLGLLLFWVDNFSLESDWYTWPLKP